MENVWWFPQNFRIELSYDPARILLRIYRKKIKSAVQRDFCTPTFTAETFIIAKIWHQPKYLPTDKWIKKISVVFFFFETAQAGLELSILLLLSPECWDYRHVPLFPAVTLYANILPINQYYHSLYGTGELSVNCHLSEMQLEYSLEFNL
jgi:hypothetical protein